MFIYTGTPTALIYTTLPTPSHPYARPSCTHRLITACTVYRGRKEVWRHVGSPCLTGRTFSDDFIADYLDRAGDDVLSSVGAYKLEGLGANLFEGIDGDYFSILGLQIGRAHV